MVHIEDLNEPYLTRVKSSIDRYKVTPQLNTLSEIRQFDFLFCIIGMDRKLMGRVKA